jgi:CheY-like chemotaxis protein
MRILVADDERDIRRTYKAALEDRDHEVVVSEDGKQCLDIYKRELRRQVNYPNSNFHLSETTSSFPSSSSSPSHSAFDVVILDYKMPNLNGLEVAKEILILNPQQRIIFASAYVRETLEDSIKQLKQVVELVQKPFDISVLIDTIEDKEASKGLMNIMAKVRQIKDEDSPTPEQLRDIFEGLRKLQKGRISWS